MGLDSPFVTLRRERHEELLTKERVLEHALMGARPKDAEPDPSAALMAERDRALAELEVAREQSERWRDTVADQAEQIGRLRRELDVLRENASLLAGEVIEGAAALIARASGNKISRGWSAGPGTPRPPSSGSRPEPPPGNCPPSTPSPGRP